MKPHPWQTPRPCAYGACKETWIPASVYQVQRRIYCSRTCCKAAEHRRTSAMIERLWKILRRCACGGCKRTFLAVQPTHRFCSKRCKFRHAARLRTAKQAALPRWLTCALPECERRFRPHDRQHLYCCEAHAIRARGRRAWARKQGKPVPPTHERCTCGAAVRRDGSLYYCAQRCGWAEIRRRAA